MARYLIWRPARISQTWFLIVERVSGDPALEVSQSGYATCLTYMQLNHSIYARALLNQDFWVPILLIKLSYEVVFVIACTFLNYVLIFEG